jgi:hypothetical protein
LNNREAIRVHEIRSGIWPRFLFWASFPETDKSWEAKPVYFLIAAMPVTKTEQWQQTLNTTSRDLKGNRGLHESQEKIDCRGNHGGWFDCIICLCQ